MAHLPTKRHCGDDPCFFIIQLNDRSLYFFSTLVTFRHVQVWNPTYLGTEAVHLYLCGVIGCILAFQHTNNDYIHNEPAILMT